MSDNKQGTTEPKKNYNRPRDESLQAFKDWIGGIVNRLNPGGESTMTEDEWEAKWCEFWGKVKQMEEKK